jgi:hypothetical protein
MSRADIAMRAGTVAIGRIPDAANGLSRRQESGPRRSSGVGAKADDRRVERTNFALHQVELADDEDGEPIATTNLNKDTNIAATRCRANPNLRGSPSVLRTAKNYFL